MARATCRCGENLKVPDDGADRIICPKCGAKVRLRRDRPKSTAPVDDGFLRFPCPCGRRLKVSADQRPTHGKCPDCGRVVPVPLESSPGGFRPEPDVNDPERQTEELSAEDLAKLER